MLPATRVGRLLLGPAPLAETTTDQTGRPATIDETTVADRATLALGESGASENSTLRLVELRAVPLQTIERAHVCCSHCVA